MFNADGNLDVLCFQKKNFIKSRTMVGVWCWIANTIIATEGQSPTRLPAICDHDGVSNSRVMIYYIICTPVTADATAPNGGGASANIRGIDVIGINSPQIHGLRS